MSRVAPPISSLISSWFERRAKVCRKVKHRLYEILEAAPSENSTARTFSIFIMTLIFLNVIAVVAESVESLAIRYRSFFDMFEVFSVLVFTAEYLSRLWACTVNPKYSHPVFGRLRFAMTFFALVDLMAIFPFYLPMIVPFDLRVIRTVRLFRVFRLFKIGRYSESLRVFARVFASKKEELLITVFIVFVLLVVASSLIYFCESEAQPEAFSSIPAAMWWAAATSTTVGYGDVYPITPMGKFFGAIIALLGIGMFALPAGLLASGFAEEIRKVKTERRICPHCGKPINGPR